MWDIYPRESWNFVYGLADNLARAGVFSFARNDPNFYKNGENKKQMD